MRDYVTVVSGIPRSGTSLMMQLLSAGGLELLTDGSRPADIHNPKGYFEHDLVKRLPNGETKFLEHANGKAVKVIYRYLPHLPTHFDYRVLLMDRDLAEVIASQNRMLGSTTETTTDISQLFQRELIEISGWICRQNNIQFLKIPYSGLLQHSQFWLCEISEFLGLDLTQNSVLGIIDKSLYRHRSI